jgi:outer membrane protein
MKNVSLILNIVLFLLVGVLFYLHFSGPPKPKPIMTTDGKPVQGMVIAYFDIDSFQQSYDYYIEKSKELEGRQAAIENELAKDQQNFQNMYIKFQQEAELMTEAEGVAAQQKLMTAKDKLDKKSENLTNQLLSQTENFNLELQENLIGFLKEYNADGRYAYILPYSKNNPNIFYVNPAYDITADVIKGMNAKYKPSK